MAELKRIAVRCPNCRRRFHTHDGGSKTWCPRCNNQCDKRIDGIGGRDVRSFLDGRVPHFHICNRGGPGEGPLFFQDQAWEVREMVLDHVERVVRRKLLS